MGNTSSVNSSLQCLVNTDELVKLCLTNDQLSKDDIMNKLKNFFQNYLIGQSKKSHYELVAYIYSKSAHV